MALSNRYDGRCSTCGAHVPAGKGSLTGPPWRTYCNQHAPSAAPSAAVVIRVALLAATLRVVAAATGGRLANEAFEAYRAACKRAGAFFRPADGGNSAPAAQAPALIAELRSAGLPVEVTADLAAWIAAQAAVVAATVDAAQARTVATAERLAAAGLALYPYQATGIGWLAGRTAGLLADDMGLGKTIQALTAAPADAPILVVCPAVAKGVWLDQARRWRPDLAPVVLSGRSSFRWPVAGEMVVLNYDILPAVVQGEGDRVASVDPSLGTPPAGCVLVGDEAHYLKSGQGKRGAARAKKFGALARACRKAGGKTWLLTATPLSNRPQELWAVLNAAGLARETFGGYPQFKQLFHAVDGRYGIEWGDPSPEVAELLKRSMLRRLKRDVLDDLPAKRWQDVEVEIDRATARTCDAAEAALAAAGVSLDAAVADARATAGCKLRFDEISAARAALATAKVPALLEIVEGYEDAAEPVIVWSAHRAPVDALASRPGWATITGDEPPINRQAIAERMQRGELRGVAATIAAGGTALTMTRAAHAVFVDLAWSPTDNSQAEDRIYRLGQSRGVLIQRLVASHRLDRKINALLTEKSELIADAVDAAAIGQYDLPPTADGAWRDAAATVATLPVAAEPVAEPIAPVLSRPPSPPTQTPFQANVSRRVAQAAAHGIRRPAATPIETWAAAGLAQLASDDTDRARVRNGVGFSQSHTMQGHVLANLACSLGLTDNEWQQAIAICRHYRRQVGEAPTT